MRAGWTVLVVLAGVGWAQPQAKSARDLAELAQGLSSEYFADVVFRLAEAGQLSGTLERTLLEEAAERAALSRQATPLAPVRGVAPSERMRVLALAQRYRTDRLSIVCRVSERLLPIDARRARRLLEDSPPGPAARPGCGDFLLPSYRPYDEALTRVLDSAAFNSEELRKGAPLEWLERRVRMMTSSLELATAARSVRPFLNRDPNGQLVAAFGAALAGLADSDRSFSFALASTVDQVLTLADEARRRDWPVAGLLGAFRDYLARHLQQPRCADTAPLPGFLPNVFLKEAYDAVQQFNLRAPRMTEGLRPLSEKERRPAGIIPVEGQAPRAALGYLLLMGQAEMLRTARLGAARDNAVRGVTRAIDEWKGENGQAENESFHQRMLLRRQLLGITPPGDLFRQILVRQLSELAGTAARREAPAEWLYHMDRLLELARPPERAARGARPPEPDPLEGPFTFVAGHPAAEEVLKAALEHFDPLIVVYAQLEWQAQMRRARR
jgi:hypothetical protein